MDSSAPPLEPSAPPPPAERRSGARLLASVLFFAALGLAAWFTLREPTRSAPLADGRTGQDGALAVRVVELRSQRYAPTITATGTLLANESVGLVSELTRKLVRIHVAEGAQVAKGDVLFELDDDDLLARRGRFRSARGLAKRTLGRDDNLVTTGIVSAEALDQSRTNVEDAQSQIDENEVMLGKTRIRAPFAGTLGIRHVSEGAWVGPTVPLASLYDTTRLKLDFRVPERWASAITADQVFVFRVAGSPDEHEGHVRVIEPQIEARTRSLLVRGIVGAPGKLRPGQFATVSLAVAPTEALFVPTIAVLPSERGHRVFVERDGVAHEVVVQLGHRTPERVEIVSGLEVGDRVIVTNLLRVRDGLAVEATPFETVASAAARAEPEGAAP